LADILADASDPPPLEEYYSNAESVPELDMDALHTLPLKIVPFETSGLKRARMIKNVHLKSVVELFRDESSGSGQIEINQLHTIFDWEDDNENKDQAIIQKLGIMNSYDIYTLRISLR
jgi:hypothetical protein